MQVILWCKKLSLVMALFLVQISYLNSFRKLRERFKTLLESIGPWLSSAQSNPDAKVAHSGAALPEPLQRLEREWRVSDRYFFWFLSDGKIPLSTQKTKKHNNLILNQQNLVGIIWEMLQDYILYSQSHIHSMRCCPSPKSLLSSIDF